MAITQSVFKALWDYFFAACRFVKADNSSRTRANLGSSLRFFSS